MFLKFCVERLTDNVSGHFAAPAPPEGPCYGGDFVRTTIHVEYLFGLDHTGTEKMLKPGSHTSLSADTST